jgi:hypothetical protein
MPRLLKSRALRGIRIATGHHLLKNNLDVGDAALPRLARFLGQSDLLSEDLRIGPGSRRQGSRIAPLLRDLGWRCAFRVVGGNRRVALAERSDLLIQPTLTICPG